MRCGARTLESGTWEDAVPSDAEDVVAIQQVLVRYTLALDTGRPDLLAGCFAEGAQVQLSDVYVMSAADFVKTAGQGLERFGATQHILGLPSIHVQGDKAWSRCYFFAQHIRAEMSPSAFLIGGWHDDELIRTEIGWRITRRRGCPLWGDGNADILDNQFPKGAVPKGPEHEAPFWLETEK